MGEVIGQEPAIDLLQRARRSGRLPHALLLHGPEGIGKGTVARAFATALLCEEEGVDACGRCNSCLRVGHGSHPDLLVVRRLPKRIREAASMSDEPVESEEGDLSPFIRVFQIRQLTEHASYAPREGRHRVFIVDPADRMNAESQNALLKTLEEPPGQSILILVCSRPHLLLTTVRSRCLSVGFAPLPASELAVRLQERGIPEEEALARAALSGGRPGRALDLDLDTLRARRDELLSFLSSLARSPLALAELPAMGSSLAGNGEDDLLEGMELLEGLLRDAACLSAGLPRDRLLHADLGEGLAKLGRHLGIVRAGELIRAVERLRGDLRFNLNRTLIAESLLAAVAGGPLP